jgi:hypothetical protein
MAWVSGQQGFRQHRMSVGLTSRRPAAHMPSYGLPTHRYPKPVQAGRNAAHSPTARPSKRSLPMILYQTGGHSFQSITSRVRLHVRDAAHCRCCCCCCCCCCCSRPSAIQGNLCHQLCWWRPNQPYPAWEHVAAHSLVGRRLSNPHACSHTPLRGKRRHKPPSGASIILFITRNSLWGACGSKPQAGQLSSCPVLRAADTPNAYCAALRAALRGGVNHPDFDPVKHQVLVRQPSRRQLVEHRLLPGGLLGHVDHDGRSQAPHLHAQVLRARRRHERQGVGR